MEILEDKPISFAYERPQYFRNVARENAWGEPVYFYPPTYSLNQYGTAGYHYEYGYPYDVNRGMKGNCTYWCLIRCYMETGDMHTELIGDASQFYSKYKGNKDGEGYIGSTVKTGDILVLSDSTYGHVIYVEKVDGDTIHISESAYSSKACYEGKACITYTLDKNKLVVGDKITLRPQAPFKEILVGVIHTGKVKEDTTVKELKAKIESLNKKLERIKAICNE